MPTRKPTKKDLELHEKALRHMLSAVAGDIAELEHETLGDGAAQNKPKEDDGGDSYFQELSLELLERDENTVREIMEALERLRDGRFGACEVCEKWIARARLRAMPHARMCIECQRAAEKKHF